MHVLLTRNLEDSKDLIQKFKSNGFKVKGIDFDPVAVKQAVKNDLNAECIELLDIKEDSILFLYFEIILLICGVFNSKSGYSSFNLSISFLSLFLILSN